MPNRFLHHAALVAALSLVAACSAHGSTAYQGAELAPQAQVNLDQARATALAARPGEIVDQELEREGGALRYSFDVKSDGVTYEVGVDVSTGAILENAPEGAHPD